MKKKSMILLAVLLTLALAMSTAVAFAGTQTKDVKVVLDGTEMSFDVSPVIEKGRTLVPFRAIFEALGCEVDYVVDAQGQHVSAVKKHKEINLTIGDNVMSVNGEKVTLDVSPRIVSKRTLVPLRAVAEALGTKVDWDDASRTVTITSVLPEEGHQVIESHGYPYQVTDGMEDGIYSVNIDPSTFRADEEGNQYVDVRYFCDDVYDIVDIAMMSVGDVIEFQGKYVPVESVERTKDGCIDVNGGYFSGNENGFTLISYEDSNCWQTITNDIYPAYYPVGEVKTVKVSKDLKLTDFMSNGEPTEEAKTADYSNYKEYMKENNPELWNCYATTIRLDMYEIMEINRIWIP